MKTSTAQDSRRDERQAFTLMEMLMVFFVVGVLAMLILGITGHAQRAAREARARAEMELIRTALQECLLKTGSYPETASWTNSALTNWLPTGFTFKDPWGAFYSYTKNGESCLLYSTGQTTNANDDIICGR